MKENMLDQGEREPILSFEDFASLPYPHPIHNNFFHTFSGWYDYKDESEYVNPEWEKKFFKTPKVVCYKKFREEHPELDAELRQLVSNMPREGPSGDPTRFLKQIDVAKKLYEAYCIMREYGASDRDLFA